MPIITKTVNVDPGYNNLFKNMAFNMAKSLANAIGTESKESVTQDETRKIFYVPTASIGYPGFCVIFDTYFDDTRTQFSDDRFVIACKINSFNDANNSPNLQDPFSVEEFNHSLAIDYIGNNKTGCPETCVMMYDTNKDTVLFDIHNGNTTHATDLDYSSNNDWHSRFALFFARDINNDVLCGIGRSSIFRMRSIDESYGGDVFRGSKYNDSVFSTSLQINESFKNVLHLTKMVNYLSPGYPEMKSAYISVIRPVENVDSKKRVCLYNVNGTQYASAGDTDIWRTKSTPSEASWRGIYFPFQPIVKY